MIRLCDICKKEIDININKRTKYCEECREEMKHYNSVIVDKYDKTNYTMSYFDDFKIGDRIVSKDNKKWRIWGITYHNKNVYHCVGKKGLKASFHAFDIRGV
jgi:hypothetical protein